MKPLLKNEDAVKTPLLELKEVSFSFVSPPLSVPPKKLKHFFSKHPESPEATAIVPILRDISLQIHSGELIAIQGPSGSGKSTLLYLLGCLLNIQKGKLLIKGRDSNTFTNQEIAQFRNQTIGFVFQQFHLLPKTSVLDNILLPTTLFSSSLPGSPGFSGPSGSSGSSGLKSDWEKKAKLLASRVGLQDRLDHYPNQLSGGQQQRVAIARALINEPEIILADEPTGNLDSRSAEQILEILKGLHREGKTVIIITHDHSVAQQCDVIYRLKDGRIIEKEILKKAESISKQKSPNPVIASQPFRSHLYSAFLKLGVENLMRNKLRSFSTMLGITIGVSAILSMITLGQFTKRKILDSYADLGVNTLVFYGYPSWERKATDLVPVEFRAFQWTNDLLPLFQLFPEIESLSPFLMNWGSKIGFAGRTIDSDVRMIGVNEDGLRIYNRQLQMGRFFSAYHIEMKSSVCIIGFEIAQRLFSNSSPLNKIIQIGEDEGSFACKVIGVLQSASSTKEWSKPNLQIYIPYTLYQATSKDWWSASIRETVVQVKQGHSVERLAKGIRNYFEKKYGKSIRIRVDSDSVLIAQMNRFLNLFSLLLGTIAFVCLLVGGIGITNMMLVSVSERYREIGLRKALGATDRYVLCLFLTEAVVLCSIAGVAGIIFGFAFYQALIFGGSKIISKLPFEWVIDPFALGISFVSILVVGILSGLLPALKAEKLQVIQALRSE